ncbi:MAG: hypothetical protein ABL949_04070 [Fimbriimonadaceae bacterium]
MLKGQILPVGACVTCGIALAFLVIWLSGPRYQSYGEQLELKVENDPKLGAHVDLPVTLQAKSGNHLLILLGNCSACSRGSEDLRKLDIKNWKSVAFVTTAETVDRTILPNGAYAQVTRDEKLHDELNAFWSPRFAVVNSEGTLIALQERNERSANFLLRAKQ